MRGSCSIRRKALLLLLAALLASSTAIYGLGPLPAAAGLARPADGEAEDFILKDVYWSRWMGQGLNNTLSVVLRYAASPEATALNATLDTGDISPRPLLVNDSYAGPLVRGQEVTFSFTFEVSENASASHYNLTLTVEYLKGDELSSFSCLLQATVSGSPDTSVSCDSYRLKKLITNEVHMVIANNGSGVARSMRVEVNPQSPYLTVIGPNVFVRDILWVGEEWSIPLRLFVEAGAGRALSVRVAITYYDQFGVPVTAGLAIGFEVGELPGPDIRLRALNESLRPNAVNVLTVQVENVGAEAAENITVSFYSYAEFLSIIGSGEFERSLLRPGERWNITLLVFVQPKVYGAVSLYAMTSYADPRGTTYTETGQIGLRVAGEGRLAISKVVCFPPSVVPGDVYVMLMVILTNIGDYVAKDVKLVLEPVPGLVEPSDAGAEEAMIPYLPMGYPANVTFLVNVAEEAKPGFYELALNVTHDGLNYVLAIPFVIREKAVFEITEVKLSPTPSPGSRGVRMMLKVVNISNVTAEQVRISVVSAYVSGVTSILIGDLLGGESRVAVLEVDFSKTAPLELEVEVQISWYQGERTSGLVSTLRLKLKLSKPSEWPDVRDMAVWAGFMALGAAVAFAAMKMRRGLF